MVFDVLDRNPHADMPFANQCVPGQALFLKRFAAEIAVGNIGVYAMTAYFGRIGFEYADVMKHGGLFYELEIGALLFQPFSDLQGLSCHEPAVPDQKITGLRVGGIVLLDELNDIHRILYYNSSMEFSENALKVLQARYLLKDEKGHTVETPAEMLRRVARSIAEAEKLYHDDAAFWEEKYYDQLSSLRFLPNSPALMNAGKSMGQLAACFVLPVEDSMQSIFDTLKNAALILQSGGGTGFSFSHLRPRSDIVKSTGGVASGPVSFIEIYNTATDVIKQGGARRGANMGILRVDHPDILEFIKIKREGGKLANFNISVSVTDAFMEALREDRDYELINPRSGAFAGRLRARAVFDEIVESAWETGDPGLIFIDRINRANPTPHIGNFESTNPCGEQPLLPYEACVLGSLNLSKYVKDSNSKGSNKLQVTSNKLKTNDSNELQVTSNELKTKDSKNSSLVTRYSLLSPDPLLVTRHSLLVTDKVTHHSSPSLAIDWDLLSGDVHTAVRFLDDSIDVNIYPLPEIERMHKGNRKIGLGVMGWADMLILLGIPYNSRRAFALARKTMNFIRDKAREASAGLADKRGVFPNFRGSVYDAPGMPRVRNATTTTVAPTGTISTIADCSSGIEPLFAVAYRRLVLDTELREINKYFAAIARKRGFYSEELMDKVIAQGSLKGNRGIPADVRRLFKTALEISYEDHIEMQVAFQEFTDNAVSKTINVPKSAKKEDVARAYILAYEKGVKGITLFRYGARKGTLVKFAEAD